MFRNLRHKRVKLRRRVFSVAHPNSPSHRTHLFRSKSKQPQQQKQSGKTQFMQFNMRRSNSRQLRYSSHRWSPSPIRTRTSSRMFQKPQIQSKSIQRKNSPSKLKTIPVEYEINSEIASLASHLLQGNRPQLLPPIGIPETSGSIQWPTNLPTFVISISPTRQRNFMDRFQHKCTPFDGTNGKTINESQWRRENRLVSYDLKRGEIGCYDSHLRLWKMLIQNEIPVALICEDDVNLTGNSQQSQYLNTLLSEAKQTPFDMMYLSWFRHSGGSTNTTHTRVQWCYCQTWAYIVTLEGMKKLIADPNTQKIHLPVDVALWEAHCRGVVRNIVAYPALTLTVGERSDTRHIH